MRADLNITSFRRWLINGYSSSSSSGSSGCFFPKNLAPKILNSYNAINGSASITCVTTSGGVKIAAPTKNKRMACFLFFFRKSTLTRPSLARKVMTRGSSKESPKASSNFEEKLKLYLFEEMERERESFFAKGTKLRQDQDRMKSQHQTKYKNSKSWRNL